MKKSGHCYKCIALMIDIFKVYIRSIFTHFHPALNKLAHLHALACGLVTKQGCPGQGGLRRDRVKVVQDKQTVKPKPFMFVYFKRLFS